MKSTIRRILKEETNDRYGKIASVINKLPYVYLIHSLGFREDEILPIMEHVLGMELKMYGGYGGDYYFHPKKGGEFIYYESWDSTDWILRFFNENGVIYKYIDPDGEVFKKDINIELPNNLDEARFSDLISKINVNDNELSDRIEREQKIKFNIDRELPTQTTLKQRYKNNKLKLWIKWFDTITHNIKNELKDRTNFKTMSEFVDEFLKVINIVLPDYIGYYIKKDGKYGIYIKEYNITIIFSINLNGVQYGNNKELYMNVITILPGNSVDEKTIEKLFVI